MNSKMAILMGIIIFLLMQNFLSVHIFNLSFILKIKSLPIPNQSRLFPSKDSQIQFNHELSQSLQPESKRKIIEDEILKTSNGNVGLLSKNQTGQSLSTNKEKTEGEKAKEEASPKEKEDTSPSFYYRHMQRYSEIIGLKEKLVTRFGQNLNASFPHSFIIRNENLCSENPYIVNLLLSAPTDFQTRLDIRNMWGSSKWWKTTKFKVVHLLGKSQDSMTNEAILAENDQYGDIVQFDFIDSYDNLTIKVLSGIHWTNLHCPNVEWVMKSDIEVLINIFKLTSSLKFYEQNTEDPQSRILCRVKPIYQLVPQREDTKDKKWMLNYDDYPFDIYPPYCSGAAYLIPRSVLPKLYAVADKLSPFRIEDAYYTGILPQLLEEHVELENIAEFSWQPTKWSRKLYETSWMIFDMEMHNGAGSTAKLWKKIISRPSPSLLWQKRKKEAAERKKKKKKKEKKRKKRKKKKRKNAENDAETSERFSTKHHYK